MIMAISLGLLIILSALFSAVETAFTSLTAVQAGTLGRKKGRRGHLVEKLWNHPEKLLPTILLGNNLVNIAASTLSAYMTITLFGNAYLGISTAIMTFVVLVFGEVTPKNLALRYNVTLCLLSADLVNILQYLFAIPNYFVTFISRLLLRGISLTNQNPFTEESILQLISMADLMGHFPSQNRRIIENLTRIDHRKISSIMTHRKDVFSLPSRISLKEAKKHFDKTQLSKIPLYKESSEDIIGILTLRATLHPNENTLVESLMEKAIFLPSSKKIHDLLHIFQKQDTHIVVIMDEYGGFEGIVTKTDLLASLLGFFEVKPDHNQLIIPLRHQTYLLGGEVSLDELKETLNLQLPTNDIEEEIQTLSGWIIHHLGRLPKRREILRLPTGMLVIKELEGQVVYQAYWRPQQTPVHEVNSTQTLS